MKKLLFNFMILSFTAFPLVSLSQWEMSSGLDGADLTQMVCVDSTFFTVSNEHGVYTKTGNNNWESRYVGYNMTYSNIVSVGNCVIAFSNFSGYPKRSCDYGNSWESLDNLYGLTNIVSIDTVLFFGPGYSFRSFDMGNTYDTIELPYHQQSGYYMKTMCDGSRLFFFYTDDMGLSNLYESTDYGETWDTISTIGIINQPYESMREIRFLNGTYWATRNYGTAPSLLYVFNTNENRWVNAQSNLPSGIINDMIVFNNKVLCSMSDHPVYSFNTVDSSWVQFASSSKIVTKFLIRNNKMHCASKQGAYSLDTNGVFTAFNSGLDHRDVTSICANESTVLVSANGEIFTSDDGGRNFSFLENSYGFQVIISDSTYYTLTSHELRISYDEGNTWLSIPNWLRCSSYYNFHHISVTNKYIFLATRAGLFRSSVDHIQWMKLEYEPFNGYVGVSNVEAIGNSVIASVGSSLLYYSDNNGIQFDTLEYQSSVKKVNQSYYLLRDPITYSHDRGQTWEEITYSPIYNTNYCIDIKHDTLVVGGQDDSSDLSVLMTYPPLIHWIDITDGLPHVNSSYDYIKEIKIIVGNIIVSNPFKGLWYRDDILTNAIEIPQVQLSNNEFVIVFPNPLFTSTTFEFNLNESLPVQISIFNHYGEQVQEISESQTAGNHKITWDASGVPSGIYYYRLRAGDQVSSGKLVVLK